MPIDLSTPILGTDDLPMTRFRPKKDTKGFHIMKDGDKADMEEYVLTLKDVLIEAINTPQEGDKPDVATMQRRYFVYNRIKKAKGPIELKAEDVALIKERMAKIYTTVVFGQACELIDPAEAAE